MPTPIETMDRLHRGQRSRRAMPRGLWGMRSAALALATALAVAGCGDSSSLGRRAVATSGAPPRSTAPTPPATPTPAIPVDIARPHVGARVTVERSPAGVYETEV